jgi:hypothetical protein
MQWTAEQDKMLVEFHAKRLGNIFIATWMRLSSAVVRARLIELDLVKPSLKAKSTRPGGRPKAVADLQMAEASKSERDRDEYDDDHDEDMIVLSGCPKGYLLPERQIASIYQSMGRGY